MIAIQITQYFGHGPNGQIFDEICQKNRPAIINFS